MRARAIGQIGGQMQRVALRASDQIIKRRQWRGYVFHSTLRRLGIAFARRQGIDASMARFQVMPLIRVIQQPKR